MSWQHRLRALLWRWHQRLGVASAVILVVIAVTGIALNHTASLKLASRWVQQEWLLTYYGLPLPARPQSIAIEHGRWLVDAEGKDLPYSVVSHACQGEMLALFTREHWHILLCTQELQLLDLDWQTIETIGNTLGFPAPVSAARQCSSELQVKSSEGWLQFDVESLRISPVSETCDKPIDGALAQALPEHILLPISGGLNWQTLMQDIHSGRVFGVVGVWVYDVAAVFLLLLSLSGFWLWYRRGRR